MAQRRATTERLGSFSDGVFAVIITIMVLELRPSSRVVARRLNLNGDGQGDLTGHGDALAKGSSSRERNKCQVLADEYRVSGISERCGT